MQSVILRCWLLVFGLGIAASVTASGTPDVKVLIDVSGSMQQNDPENLRKPALRMLVELLPPDAVAGVWLFAEDTDILVAHGRADQDWKAAAISAVDKVHSRGLFTNIETALDVAIRDWAGNESDSRRSLILLTDGVVDVSKNPDESVASRNRILAEGLRELRAAGVTVHTIGLSDNFDAELMSALAKATDGWQESASDAATLQRVFLRMFEQAVQPDSVPLQDNRFLIDASISEFTVLIFNPDPKREISLILPDGGNASFDSHPESFRWRVDNGYHLITVDGPLTGQWRIDAELDPDNRVMIVTDLEFEVTPMAANLLKGESISLSAHITEQDKKISRAEFLELVEVSATRTDGADSATASIFPLDAEDAVFSGVLATDFDPGRYEIVVKADSKTFSREVRQRFVVHASPLSLEVVAEPDQSSAGAVRAKLEPDVVSASDVLAMATLMDQTGQQNVVHPVVESAHSLMFELPASEGQSEFTLSASIRSPSGRVLMITPPSLLLGKPVEQQTASPEVVVEDTPLPEETGFDFEQGSLVIGGSNFGFLTLAGITWVCLRKPKEAKLEKQTAKSTAKSEEDRA